MPHLGDPNTTPPQVILNDFLGSLPLGEPVRIEISPVTPGSAIWAYLSVTHNEAQHITAITPDR